MLRRRAVNLAGLSLGVGRSPSLISSGQEVLSTLYSETLLGYNSIVAEDRWEPLEPSVHDWQMLRGILILFDTGWHHVQLRG